VITTGQAVAIENTSEDERVHPDLRDERAMIAVPLKFRNHISGVLYVNDNKPRPFSVNDRQRLSRLAEYAVIAIENSQLLTELRFSRYQLQTLLRASQSLGALSRPDDVLSKLIENAVSASEADWGTVILYEDGEIKRLTGYPHLGDFTQEHIRENGNTIRIFQTGKTLYFEDIDKHPDNVNPITLEQKFKSVVGLPLTSDHGTIGVLWLHYYHPQRFSSSYIEALEAYARQGATIYNNTVRALNLTQMIAKVMQLSGSKRVALRSIAEMMQELVKCHAIALYVYNAEREEIEYPPTLLDIQDEESVLFRPHIDPHSIIYTMMYKTQRYVVENVETDAYLKDTRFAQAEGIKSCVVIPLHANDKKVGVMFVNYRVPRRFSDDDLNYMQIFANFAAEAINNTQLLNQSQERATALDLLRDIQSQISSAQDIDTILSKIAVGATALTKIPPDQGTGVIFLIDWHGGQPNISDPFPRDIHVPRPQLDSDKSIARYVIETWETVVIPDVIEAAEAGGIVDTWVSYGARAMVVTPLIIREQVIGVLYVLDQYRPRKFTEAEIGYLKTLAGEAAIAIQNARLLQQQVKAFDEIAESIPVSKTVEQILKHVLQWPSSLIGPLQSANIRLLDGDELYVAAYLPEDVQRDPLYERIPVGEGVTGWVAQHKQTVYVPDVTKEPRYKEYIAGAQSQLAVPLLIGGECIGVLNLEHPVVNAFSASDIQLVEAIAKLAVVAHRNISQFQQIQDVKGKRLETINAMAASFSASSRSVKQVLNELFEWIVILSQDGETDREDTITLIEIRFLKRKTNELVLAQHRGGSNLASKRISMNEGIIGWVAREKQTRYVPDVSQEPMYKKLVAETKSELAVPMMKGNRLIGVINIESSQIDAFNDDDRQMMEAMARLVTAAIGHARRYQQLNKIRGQLVARTALARLGMTSNAWYHEIRGHSNTIADMVKLARNYLEAGSMDDMVDTLDEIQKMALKISRKHEAYPLDVVSDVESLSINHVLETQLRSYLKSDVRIIVQFDPLLNNNGVTIRASAWGLRQVFDIIIDNAIKAMKKSDKKQITISTVHQGRWAVIKFRDTGSGMPREILRQLKRNRPVVKQPGELGLGLGLLLSRVIVETYDGKLEVRSQENTGTSIIIKLPVERQ
jgi:GAF domain-containing protein